MNEIVINVRVSSRFGEYSAGIAVEDFLQESFAALAISDDRFLGYIAGEPSDAQVQKIIKLRSDAAKDLAMRLTDIILDAMRANDTHNGYKERDE